MASGAASGVSPRAAVDELNDRLVEGVYIFMDYGDIPITPYIVKLDSNPVGFIQHYKVNEEINKKNLGIPQI
ncbi:hypothetical protein ACI48J_07020 [Paenibacillus chitinolyticus]|uniref:hypothetical protein n=1 Tax=Paenibacillus chitinolyticus TaxID=79263 RepID=UPI0038693F09